MNPVFIAHGIATNSPTVAALISSLSAEREREMEAALRGLLAQPCRKTKRAAVRVLQGECE